MTNIKELWEKYKSLKWYWKVFLFLPIIIAIICLYCVFFIFTPDKINETILERNKDSTDTFIKDFEEKEIEEEKKRKSLQIQEEVIKKEIETIEKRVKEEEKKHDELLWKINDTKPDELKSLYADLRERGRNS